MSLWNNTDAQTSKPKSLMNGQLRGIQITAGGSGYTPANGTASATVGAPDIAGGVQATATVTITAGVITGIAITNAGSGYTAVPSVTYTTGGTLGSMVATIRGSDRHEVKTGVTNPNAQIVFIDETEAQVASNRAKGLKTPGWNKFFEYVDNAGTPRYKVDPLIAITTPVGTSGDATDDTIVADSAFSIGTQPVAVTIAAPTATTFSVVAAGATSYQWQVKIGAAQYVNVTNGGVYTTATTATLNISNTTGLNGNRYRCQVANTTAGSALTSTGALLTVTA